MAGLSQGTAEEYYILAAQQLDGYGQETFEAKVCIYVCISSASRCGVNLTFFLAPLELGKGLESISEVERE
jgi:hypothetical protein